MPVSKECHVLPCKIDYSGKVSDYIYFHPQSLEQEEVEEKKASTSSSTASFRAAQFRGRGLLSCTTSQGEDGNDNDDGNNNNSNGNNDDTTMHGRLLVKKAAKGSGIQVAGVFDRITEWHHEHQPSQVLATTLKENNKSVTTRAREWCQIASVLHRPIPVEEEG